MSEKFACCIVWCPIPVLTYILPFVGHLGVSSSQGRIYDFAGSYYIRESDDDTLAFGSITRYIELDIVDTVEWDNSIKKYNLIFENKFHSLCFNNCHSHVAYILQDVKYKQRSHWNMVILAAWVFFFGKFVSFSAFLKSIVPSLIFWGFILFLTVGV